MKYVEFIGEQNILYKVLGETKTYILYFDPVLNDRVWERKKYIEREIEIQ